MSGGSTSSPMQRLLALNPFRHMRSRSELPPSQLAGSGRNGSGSGGGARSQPATPSNPTVDAAALLQRSAMCMQKAVQITADINTGIKTAKLGSAPSSTATSPTAAGPLESFAGGSAGRSSPSKLLGWMGLKSRAVAQKVTEVTPPGAWSIAADASSAGLASDASDASRPTSPRHPLGEVLL